MSNKELLNEMLPQPVGLLKHMLNLFHIVNVQGGLQVFKVFYVAWLYQLSDVDCENFMKKKFVCACVQMFTIFFKLLLFDTIWDDLNLHSKSQAYQNFGDCTVILV